MENLISPKQLSDEEYILFERDYDEKKKYTSTTWLLCLFLAGLGAHQFYLGNKKGGVIRLCFGVLSLCFLVIFYYLTTLSIVYPHVISFQTGDVVSQVPDFVSIIEDLDLVPLMLGVCGIIHTILWIYDLFTLQKQIFRANRKIEDNVLSKFTPKETKTTVPNNASRPL